MSAGTRIIDHRRNRYAQVLLALGVLWLLLTFGLLAYRQFNAPRVEVRWETATEQGTAGFNLYRSQAENDDYVLVNEGDFINSRGGPVSGARYSYVDRDVDAGETYFYILEELETDGSSRRYTDDLFEYEVPVAPAWLGVLAIFCGLVGLVLLFVGAREIRNI